MCVCMYVYMYVWLYVSLHVYDTTKDRDEGQKEREREREAEKDTTSLRLPTRFLKRRALEMILNPESCLEATRPKYSEIVSSDLRSSALTW